MKRRKELRSGAPACRYSSTPFKAVYSSLTLDICPTPAESHKMGSAQSSEERNGDDDEVEQRNGTDRSLSERRILKKILQQEPEVLPCHASASPLSPQPSTVGTPRLGPSIKVWDPYNVLSAAAPTSPSPFALSGDNRTVELYLIVPGECDAGLRRDLVGGRWPTAALTPNESRQVRSLAVFLKSQGVRFNAVYSSPLDRARTTAMSVCQELNFAEEQIQSSDALIEMSQGQWEGCHCSEIYTPEMVNFMERSQPDFSAPSGESLRQVEFRMIQFLNSTISRLSEKQVLLNPSHQSANNFFSRNNPEILASSIQDRDVPASPQSDLFPRHQRAGLSRKTSGKSRLQFVTTGDNVTDDDFSPREVNQGHLHGVSLQSSYTIGVFTHATPIKCLLLGLLGCSPAMIDRICIDDSSTTEIQHSLRSGWQFKRINDTTHLRLM